MISAVTLRDYVTMLFVRMGCGYDAASTVADVLVEGDLRGASSHGVTRVKDYYQLVEAKRLCPSAVPEVVYQSPSTATLSGASALGPVVAQRGMQLAIDKARTAGTGWVAVRGSHHFGVAAYYSSMALEANMVGVAMSNGYPLVAPVFCTSRMLGTNPISVAVPALRHSPLLFDFSTASITRSRLLSAAADRVELPRGLVQDALGCPTTDPSTIQRGGAILPLGGDRVHGGHKGFCIGAVVDIFSSLFSGANFGPFVPPPVSYLPLPSERVGEGIGHFFGAIRVDAFRPEQEFRQAVDQWIEVFRTAKGVEGTPGVIIPGEQEQLTKDTRLKDGIPLSPQVVRDLNGVAKVLGCESIPYTPDSEKKNEG